MANGIYKAVLGPSCFGMYVPFCWALPSFEMILSGALENIRAPILDPFFVVAK